MSVVIETTIGDLTVDLLIEERPVACLNFIKLCKMKYYNFNLFHTVEQGFIAQTGDPSGAGDGGSSVWGVVEGTSKRFFEAESLPKIYHTNAGMLSLVSAGKNLAGSQFFFTLGECLTSLDGIHCVIGEVVEGHETLRKLNEAIVDEQFRPYQDIRITHTVVLDDPFPDPRGFQVPSRSPSPTAERLKNGRIAADEDIDDTDGKTMEEIQEMLAEREAKARATILEIVGDLPDADMAPPENVLFVCKLNPVTTDDDLEIIFSRFGKVKGCEVIRDKKSGDSLQYAFVEFDDNKSCEAAYFKMDNVLIDDRRIHVDFSQSVAKVKWRGKGRGVEGPDGRIDFNNLGSDTQSRKGQGQERRQTNGNKQNERDNRNRMNSEERRKLRAERHRAQEEQERDRKSFRKSRSRGRNERSRYENKYNAERRVERTYQERKERTQTKNNRVRDESRKQWQEERHRYSRSRSRDHYRRYSPERSRRPYSEKRASDTSRQRKNTPERNSRHTHIVEKKRHAYSSEREKSIEKQKMKYKKDEKYRRAKKPRDTSSESGDSSDSETDTSPESDSTDSSSSSSSQEDVRKKKSKKSKKKSNKSRKKHKKNKK